MSSILPGKLRSPARTSRRSGTLVLGLAAVLFVPTSGQADSAIGVVAPLGNSLSPSPTGSRPLDADWLVAKHTPTGQLYKLPFAIPDIRKAASGWEYSGQVEFGLIGGDADEQSARFRTYQDIDNGAFLNNFSLQLRQPKSGYSIDVSGGGAGRHDQYYGLQVGRVNQWKVKVYFSETPHVFTHRYKSLWSGIGTSNLTLLPGLTAGGTASTTNDNVDVTNVAAQGVQTISLTRKRSGVRVDVDLSKSWKGYVSYGLENRQGARPFGAVWGNNPGTAPIEIVEPVDYDTHDLLAGLIHTAGLNAFNLRVSASLFRNQISTLTFQEPFRIAPPAGITTIPAAGAYTDGRFDLAPSNNAYNVRGEYTRAMPEFYKGYFTAVLSAGSWRQDDSLIPYAMTPISLANVTLLPGGSWDSVTALSRRKTDAVVDTRLVDLTLSLNPTASLNVKGKARFYETDNNTDPFLSVNPNAVYLDADSGAAGNQSRGLTLDGVTGVWGRPLNDGSGQSILFGTNANAAGNIPIKSDVYSSKQHKFGGTADYRLTKFSSVNAAVDRDTTERTNRERDRTWDDRAKLGYVNRGLGVSTARVSYEAGRRRGDEYVPTSYDNSFSSALAPVPTTPGANVASWVRMNSGFRSYDLADRDQYILNARLDTMLRQDLDVGISAQRRRAKYPNSQYGRTGDSQSSYNVDLNYQPSPRRTVYGFYSYQLGRFGQANIASANGALVIGGTTALGVVTPENALAIGSAPGGPIYPLINEWTASSRDRNHVVGAGVKQDFGKVSLNVDYSYSIGRTRIDYAYTVGGAINAANAPRAGTRMPDLATDMSYLDASFRIPLSERLSARLVYRYQKEAIRDWHYQNVDETPIVPGGNAAALPTAVLLDGGSEDYRVNWYGVMLQIKL